MRIEMLLEKQEGPIILWMTYPHRGNEAENLLASLGDMTGVETFSLYAVFVDDWDKDLSPWEAHGIAGDFPGGGADTLRFLQEQVLPNIKKDAERPLYIMGYSLAGLYALWAIGENDLFDGAICASSSFWYNDFLAWLEGKKNLQGKKVYLSLGGKEKNTPNQQMATIEDCTRKIEQLLKKDNKVILEMNSGGHFADSGKRLVKGLRWILKTK